MPKTLKSESIPPYDEAPLRVENSQPHQKSYGEALSDVERRTGVKIFEGGENSPLATDLSDRDHYCVAVTKTLGQSGLECPIVKSDTTSNVNNSTYEWLTAIAIFVFVAAAIVFRTRFLKLYASRNPAVSRNLTVFLTVFFLWAGSVLTWHLITNTPWPSLLGTTALLIWPPVASVIALNLWLQFKKKS